MVERALFKTCAFVQAKKESAQSRVRDQRRAAESAPCWLNFDLTDRLVHPLLSVSRVRSLVSEARLRGDARAATPSRLCPVSVQLLVDSARNPSRSLFFDQRSSSSRSHGQRETATRSHPANRTCSIRFRGSSRTAAPRGPEAAAADSSFNFPSQTSSSSSDSASASTGAERQGEGESSLKAERAMGRPAEASPEGGRLARSPSLARRG